MAPSSNIRLEPKAAVFVSYAPADQLGIFEVADKITASGATVFLDEICLRAPRESHILDALSLADELLIVITATREDPLDEDKDPIPAFLDRRFIWLAIGAANARGIPIRGLLKGVTRREVMEDPDIPAFIKEVTLFETLESYEASLQVLVSKARLNTRRRLKSHCRACLFCRPRTAPARAAIEKQLKGAGVEIFSWRPDSKADNRFDAVAVVFHDGAGKIWETPGLVPFLLDCVDGQKPVVLLTLPGEQRPPEAPNRRLECALSHVEYRKSDNLCLLQLLWALAGYQLYDLTGSEAAEQVSPLKSSPISAKDKELLIEILSTKAASSIVSVEKYFRDLVAATNWPEHFKNQRAGGWSGNAISDARSLIDFAIARSENPLIKGYTFLGSILECLVNDVGAHEAKQLFEIVRHHVLIRDDQVVNELRRKTQGS